jgi:molybdate/tungstate transport system ATP-binding protein
MICLQDVEVQAGAFHLQGISLNVPTGQYGVLMGKTGCGKTTLLESLLGLRRITSGRIRIGEEDVTHQNPAVRGIGYVPQGGALFARMTVRDHLSFALAIRGIGRRTISSRVDELAAILRIGHLLDRRPRRLSGGERQRVALGRALSFRPRVLCLDEPLSALDQETREQMCELLQEIKHRTGVTTLHVTHSLDEAERLADCLFRLVDGKIETTSFLTATP